MEDIQFSKKSVIIGAGGLGRELLSFINHSQKEIKVPEIAGFIDDDASALAGYNLSERILGKITDAGLDKYHSALLAINNSQIKKEIFIRLGEKIEGFTHHSCIIGDRAKIDKSVIIFPNVLVSCDTTVERGVFINCGTQVGHDVHIEEFTNIMANVDIGGGCRIGKNVMIGTGATIFPRVTIADNAIIGAGSVVFKNVKREGTYAGNPARKIF